MKATLESTGKIANLRINGVDVSARIWQGASAAGVPMHAFIFRVEVATDLPGAAHAEFARDLQATAPLRPDLRAVDWRLVV